MSGAAGASRAPRAPSLLVVLPAYDEASALPALLERMDRELRAFGRPYRVILVDDGSRDGTLALARDYATRMPLQVEHHPVNQGLGATLRDGLEAAARRCGDDDAVVVMDADDTHDPALVPRLVEALEAGADVAIASRYRPGSRVHGLPRHRAWLSLGARWLFQLAFPIRGVRDYTCGYRAYRGRLLHRAQQHYGPAFVDQAGFQCSVDLLLKLHALGARFREVPLVLHYDRKGGASKMRVASTVWETLALLVRRRLGLG